MKLPNLQKEGSEVSWSFNEVSKWKLPSLEVSEPYRKGPTRLLYCSTTVRVALALLYCRAPYCIQYRAYAKLPWNHLEHEDCTGSTTVTKEIRHFLKFTDVCHTVQNMTWQRNLGLYYNQQIQEYVKITVWSENKNKNEDFYFSLHFSQQFIL